MNQQNAILEQQLKHAVALLYDGEQAPKVIATGEDALAAEILSIANEHEIPICENPALIQVLRQLEIGDEIPKELYIAIAHILAFAMSLSDTRQPA